MRASSCIYAFHLFSSVGLLVKWPVCVHQIVGCTHTGHLTYIQTPENKWNAYMLWGGTIRSDVRMLDREYLYWCIGKLVNLLLPLHMIKTVGAMIKVFWGPHGPHKSIYAWGGTIRSDVCMLDRKYLYWCIGKPVNLLLPLHTIKTVGAMIKVFWDQLGPHKSIWGLRLVLNIWR